MSIPTPQEIAAACGISIKAAKHRLCKFRRGEIGRDSLMRPFVASDRDDRRGNAEWLALGDEQRSHRLAAIPGCTATERSVFGIVDAEPPEPPMRAKGENLTARIMDESGVCYETARYRAKRYRLGEIGRAALFAPPRLEESRAAIDEVVARVGCCRKTAASRLRRYRIGAITQAQLYAPATGGRKCGAAP